MEEGGREEEEVVQRRSVSGQPCTYPYILCRTGVFFRITNQHVLVLGKSNLEQRKMRDKVVGGWGGGVMAG